MIVDNRKGITRNRSRKKFGSRDWSANASPIINRLQSGKVPPRFHYYDSFFLTVFSFAPRQYKINPRKIEASVPPTSRNSKLHLFTASPGGTSETTIPNSTTTNPRIPHAHKPNFPPGIRIAYGFSARSFRPASFTTPANM